MAHYASIPPTQVPYPQPSVATKIQQFTALVAGVSEVVTERAASLNKLGDRCRMIEAELDQRSTGLQTPAVEGAIIATKSALQDILLRCQGWLDKGMLRRSVNNDTIQRDLVQWNDRLSDCMQEFARSIVFEVLNLTSGHGAEASRFYVRILKQGETFTALLGAIERNTEITQRQVQQLMNQAQEVQMRSPQLSGQERDQLYESLRSILFKSKSRQVLPLVEVQGDLQVDEFPQLRNHGSDIFMGHWNGRVVAVKRLRDPNSSTQRVAVRYIWRMLKHPNVLPFFGIHTNQRAEVGLVTVWMPHSDVIKYVQRKPNCDRRAIIRGAADGLAYLHRQAIVHGDIRGSKILIDEVTDITGVWPQARIADFGLAASSEADQEAVFDGTSASLLTTVCRWLAPERCNSGSSSLPVFASDVFSFGRTMIEISTGEKPFPKEKAVFHLIKRLVCQELWPERPIGDPVADAIITDEVWQLMLEMQAQEPAARPTMIVVQARLEQLM
ncbi:kinase-like protein [Calocera cornea HHB12733]|uniref:Kinase-like protein n=1 Tax=Calocera cornea HHB12733 TaxID=1353952 RepID=A0A165F063_9BASI|nr:kinase-like protein [Calocera cornea HHB12733]